MKIYIFIIPLLLFLALIAYIAIRGWQTLSQLPLPARTIYLVTILLLFASLLTIFASIKFTIPYAKQISFVGYTGLIVFIYLILLFLIVDLVRIANYFIHFAPTGMLIFRKWAFLAGLIGMTIVMIVGNYQFNHPKIKNLRITLNAKTLDRETLRIAFCSDLHLGVSIDKKQLQQYVTLINAQNPDIIFLVGDIFDHNITPVITQNMHEELQQFNAPLGVYAVAGNHEYIGGNVNPKIEYLKKGNARVLQDSVALIGDNFYVVGRDDRSNANRKSIAQLLVNIDHNKPLILLDHQPYHLEEAEKNGIDLQLSGHTHGGQFFPITLLVNRIYEQAYGYLQHGNTHYYISSGLGIWGPQYRIGSQSELVIIDLSSRP